MVEAAVETPLAAVDTAIAAHDRRAFAKAYDGLTTGCNSCHGATGNDFMVIKTPAAGAFPDQEFRSAKP
jgi:cytochrome c553